MTTPKRDIYGGKSPTDVPAYSPSDAARYLSLPVSTVRSWLFGQDYKTRRGRRRFQHIILVADPDSRLLSFRNLVELHVLRAIRTKHQLRLREVRPAVDYIRKQFAVRHPLSDEPLWTEGRQLFVEKFGEMINASASGQAEIDAALRLHLERVERDIRGPIRLFPFETRKDNPALRRIVIDPRIQFGRPCIVGAAIPTSVVIDRFRGGDEIQEIAEDYGQTASDIEAAIRYEQLAA